MVHAQARRAQGGDGAGLAAGAGRAGVRERQHHVLEHGEARQQVEALEDEADGLGADLRELVVGERGYIEPGEPVGARRRGVEAADDVHEGST